MTSREYSCAETTIKNITERTKEVKKLEKDYWGDERYCLPCGTEAPNEETIDHGNILVDLGTLTKGIQDHLCCKVCAEEERSKM